MAKGLSSFQAAATVIGLLVGVGAPALWWVFYRMDNKPRQPQGDPLPTAAMTPTEIKEVEVALSVSLPESYSQFLSSGVSSIDGESVFRTAGLIIDATMMYRRGELGNPAWPPHFIYVGDEADACPYALNCDTGELLRLDHGNVEKPPLEYFDSFGAYVAQRVESHRIEMEKEIERQHAPPLVGLEKLRHSMSSHLRFNGPAYVALLVAFVVIPIFAISMREFFRWLLQ